MSKVFGFASLSVLMTIGLMMTGCSGQQPSAPSATAQNQSVAVGHERQGSGHGGHQQGFAEERQEERQDTQAWANSGRAKGVGRGTNWTVGQCDTAEERGI